MRAGCPGRPAPPTPPGVLPGPRPGPGRVPAPGGCPVGFPDSPGGTGGRGCGDGGRRPVGAPDLSVPGCPDTGCSCGLLAGGDAGRRADAAGEACQVRSPGESGRCSGPVVGRPCWRAAVGGPSGGRRRRDASAGKMREGPCRGAPSGDGGACRGGACGGGSYRADAASGPCRAEAGEPTGGPPGRAAGDSAGSRVAEPETGPAEPPDTGSGWPNRSRAASPLLPRRPVRLVSLPPSWLVDGRGDRGGGTDAAPGPAGPAVLGRPLSGAAAGSLAGVASGGRLPRAPGAGDRGAGDGDRGAGEGGMAGGEWGTGRACASPAWRRGCGSVSRLSPDSGPGSSARGPGAAERRRRGNSPPSGGPISVRSSFALRRSANQPRSSGSPPSSRPPPLRPQRRPLPLPPGSLSSWRRLTTKLQLCQPPGRPVRCRRCQWRPHAAS